MERNEDTVIVGIDNGISGGLCAISNWSGDVIAYTAMPTNTFDGKTEVDVYAVLRWLQPYCKNLVVCIEEPLRHAKSSQAMRSMSISFGKIIGACEAKQYAVRRIQVKEWQDVMLGKRLAKGMTKVAALKKANDLWPKEKWLASSRSKTPHDGIVDAALISRYYRDTEP
jgi:hypothetical protein